MQDPTKNLIDWKTNAWKDPNMVAWYSKRMVENTGTNVLKNLLETRLLKRLVTGRDVLDVGIGTGRGSIPLAKAGYNVSGIDSSQAMLDETQRLAGNIPMNLQVGDVQTARDFYVGTLGFEKTAGWHGQALFVSAGRYHHHMAMNVWNSRGAGPRKDTLGLGEVLIEVPTGDDVGALADRLRVAGVPAHHTGAELRFEDPWRNKLRVAVR